MNLSSEQITVMLHAWGEGEAAALEQLLPLVYDELHRLASAYLPGERRGHSLQTTALINEAYVRLAEWKNVERKNRAHFLGLAAHMMRRVLVNFARSRHSAKRGGATPQVEMDEAKLAAPHREAEILALDDGGTQILWVLFARPDSCDQCPTRFADSFFWTSHDAQE